MKKLLLFTSAICFAVASQAQVSFNNVLFSQNFEGAVVFTGANNSTDMGTFNGAIPATANPPANTAITTESTNKVFRIQRPQAATTAAADVNNYALLRNMSFTGAAPEKIKFQYTVRYLFTSAAPATSNLTNANNFVQIASTASNSTTGGIGAGTNLFNINYSARIDASANRTYFNSLDVTVSASPSTDYSTYIWFINNGSTAYTYTDPNNAVTPASLAAGTVDIWVKIGVATTYTLLKSAQPLTASLTFGGFKLSSNSNSYSAGGAPMATEAYFDNISVSTADLSTLPISLTSLTGKANGKAVQINWATASETNNNRYEVQRSNDGKNFSTIGSLKGAGTSNSASAYTFTDENPGAGTNYYRLKQYDFDGTISTSETIAVKSNVAETTLSVYSDGSQTNVQIISANTTSANLHLYDINGRKLVEQSVNLATGFNKVSINKGLTPGIYFVKLIDGGKVVTQKFAVQ